MHKKLLSIMACPVCKGKLAFRRRSQELVCEKDQLAFPVRNGCPVLLVSDARQLNPLKKP